MVSLDMFLASKDYKAKDYTEARDIALKHWGIKKPSKLPRLVEVSDGWYSHNYSAKIIFIKKEGLCYII